MRKLLPIPLVCLATAAQAIGLGNPVETPTLGKPLRLEIPLTGHTGAPPAIECLQLSPLPTTADALYFPRTARIQIEMRQGRPVAVVAGGNVLQPVVEFRLTLGCTYGLARDYTLLTALPLLENPKPTVEPPVAPRPAIAAASLSAETLRLTQETTLEFLARQRYPNQPKAREKFKRMMRVANSDRIPAGEGFDTAPLPAGMELSIPRGLPERRQGPYIPPRPSAPPTKPTSQPVQSPATAYAPTASPTGKGSPAKDRLVLDAAAAPPLSAAEAETELARLEAVHANQVKAQEALDERIARAQEAFADIKEHLLRTEARLRTLEEQNKELARRNDETQAWQLAIAVLLGGVLGAGLLRIYPLLSRRRTPEEEFAILPPSSPAATAKPAERPPSPAIRSIPEEFPALRTYGSSTGTAPVVAPRTTASETMAPESLVEPTPIPPVLEPLDFDFTPATSEKPTSNPTP